jgi:hypothetical protein
LQELYRLRALQLRGSYDHLILLFSGGSDSVNILHAFIDNNIFLDEIVMEYPENFNMNNQERDSKNFYSEIKYAAWAHLDKYKHLIDSRTKIRNIDISKPMDRLIGAEDWYDKIGTDRPNPSLVARQLALLQDTVTETLTEKGRRVCHIYGVDKPLVYIDNNEYYCYFSDSNAIHAVDTGRELANVVDRNLFPELFYWSSEFPEIVVKQAQTIKAMSEFNPLLKQYLSNFKDFHIEAARQYIDPIIYDVTKLEKFQTGKPRGEVVREMDDWFWKPKSHIITGNFLNTVNYLNSRIDKKYFVNSDLYNGYYPVESQRYKL